MNWGMGQALGAALQRMGDVWGPGRLDMQRELEEDARRQATHELNLKLGTSSLATQDQARSQAAQRFPKEMAALDLEAKRIQLAIDNGQLDKDKGLIALQDIRDKQAAMAGMPGGAVGYHKGLLEAGAKEASLQPDLLRAQINQANAGAARASADARRDEIMMQPWNLTQINPSIRASIEDFRRRNMLGLRSEFGQVRYERDPLTGKMDIVAGNKFTTKNDPNAEISSAFNQFRKNLIPNAEIIARSMADTYEGYGGKWGKPEDRQGRINQEMARLVSEILGGIGGGDASGQTKTPEQLEAERIAAAIRQMPSGR